MLKLYTCDLCEGMGRIAVINNGNWTTITCPECMGQGSAEIETCGATYPYLLDGMEIVCDDPAAHDGNHIMHMQDTGETYEWEA